MTVWLMPLKAGSKDMKEEMMEATAPDTGAELGMKIRSWEGTITG
jgi:hypothetical protein